VARRGFLTARRVLALALVALTATTLLPARYLGWARIPGRIVQRLVSPPADLVKVAGDWLVRAEPAEHPEPLVGQIDQLRAIVQRLEIENQRLRRENDELRGLRSTQGSAGAMRLITASVIAGSSDPSGRLLRVRAGTREGVGPGSVATARGQHLLGRVVALDEAMCEVLPITDRNADTIEVITEGEGPAGGLRFDLTPTGEGTLRGPGRYVTEGLEQIPRVVEVGQLVRLSDASWAEHAGLTVGEIVAVEASEQSPLRQVITVRPQIDTRRVSSVVLRVPGGAP